LGKYGTWIVFCFSFCFCVTPCLLPWYDHLLYVYFSSDRLTNSMEQSLSWEADSHLASEEIPCHLWNFEVHYCVHKSLPLDPVLSHVNPVHAWTPFFIICFNIVFPLPWSLNGFFPSGFQTKILYAFLTFPMHVTCPTHLILLELITFIIFDEEYKLQRSSLCSYLHSSVTSSLFKSKHSPQHFALKHQFSHPYKVTGKIIVLYISLQAVRLETGR
jgi:hypothetical protein